MSRKFIFSIFAVAVVVSSMALSASAQLAPVSGTIQLEAADGTKTPVAGALIEVYRTDMKTGFPSGKTSKNGSFTFAGLPLGGVYTFAISAPGIAPMVWPNVRGGQEKIVIIVHPGDGHKLTEEEARGGAALASAPAGQNGELTAEQKKAQADYEKQVAAVNAKNARIEASTKIVDEAIKAGSDAYAAKNYEAAIAEFNKGLEAEPNYVGVSPVLLNNRAAAYDSLAIDVYNAAAKEKTPEARRPGFAKAREDLLNSINSYKQSWDMLVAAAPGDIRDQNNYNAAKTQALRGVRTALRHAVQTDQVDAGMIDAAKLLLPEYQKIETDAQKKVDTELILGDMYRILDNGEESVTAYKKVLETQPENPDALVGAGLVLVNMSFAKDNDKVLAQEGANYLQKFVSIAPDTHKLKEGANQYLALLKEQSIVPEKGAGKAPKKKP